MGTNLWSWRQNTKGGLRLKISAITINSCCGAIGAFLGWYLGGLDDFLYALLIFMLVDYLTGILCAINEHRLSSEIGFRGLTRKVLILVLVGIANVLDIYWRMDPQSERLLSSSTFPMKESPYLKTPAILACRFPIS